MKNASTGHRTKWKEESKVRDFKTGLNFQEDKKYFARYITDSQDPLSREGEETSRRQYLAHLSQILRTEKLSRTKIPLPEAQQEPEQQLGQKQGSDDSQEGAANKDFKPILHSEL